MMDSDVKSSQGYFKWIILLCSFINHMCTTGMIYSLSVIYVSWLDEFRDGKGVTSWILSIGFGLLSGIGPIPASIAAKYGFRTVGFIGGLLTATGLIASAFATSVSFLIVSMGIVAGIGWNFCYLPSVAMVALHFDKRRSLAMGIATCGVGVGSFIFGPLINYLVDMYTWRGAMLILASISLNMCVTGLLFRPVKSRKINEIYQAKACRIYCSGEEALKSLTSDDNPVIKVQRMESDTLLQRQISDDNITNATNYQSWIGDNSRDAISQNSFTSENSKKECYYVCKNKRLDVDDCHRCHNSLNELAPKDTSSLRHSLPNLLQIRQTQISHESVIKSLRNLDLPVIASICGFRHHTDDSTKDELEIQSDQGKYTLENRRLEKTNEITSFVSRLLSSPTFKTNLNLLRDKVFLTFCFGNFLTNLSYVAPVLYLVDRAVYEGIEKATGAILISATGCGTIFGRMVTGALADNCCSNRLLVYILALCSQGLGNILSAFCGDIVFLHVIYAAFIGFHMGIYAVLTTLVTVDLKGVANIASAFGLLLLFVGAATLIGPPVTGWIFDWTKSYAMCYIINGVCLIISGLMLVPLLCRHPPEQRDDNS